MGPQRAQDHKSRVSRGVLGGKRGSSHESCAARLSLCHAMRNRYVLMMRVKYPSAVEKKRRSSGWEQKRKEKKKELASKNKIRH